MIVADTINMQWQVSKWFFPKAKHIIEEWGDERMITVFSSVLWRDANKVCDISIFETSSCTFQLWIDWRVFLLFNATVNDFRVFIRVAWVKYSASCKLRRVRRRRKYVWVQVKLVFIKNANYKTVSKMFLVRNMHYFHLDDLGSHATSFTGCKNLSDLILFIYVFSDLYSVKIYKRNWYLQLDTFETLTSPKLLLERSITLPAVNLLLNRTHRNHQRHGKTLPPGHPMSIDQVRLLTDLHCL